MHEFEFPLEPQFRQHLAIRGFGALGVGAIALLLGIVNASHTELVVAAICLFVAAISGALWTWRARFGTRITREGIEVRRYFGVKNIPWSEVRDIQALFFNRDMPIQAISGRSNRSRNSGGGTKIAACVKIVRKSGRGVILPAPIVTRGESDPYFNDKVRAIKAAREAVRTGSGISAQVPR